MGIKKKCGDKEEMWGCRYGRTLKLHGGQFTEVKIKGATLARPHGIWNNSSRRRSRNYDNRITTSFLDESPIEQFT